MYRLLALSIMVLCPALALAAPPAEFPYKAYISAEEVYVRSGPGDDYYPTDKLKVGTQVEVYRHDPGGWFAIRPPEGSFTWVSSRFLEMREKGLAKVTADRVAARVGTTLSDIRDVIQVRLDKGEMVEVLETREGSDNGQKTIWCKIAPPAGEFRWVFGKYVDRAYPRDGIRRGPPPLEAMRVESRNIAAGGASAAEGSNLAAFATTGSLPPPAPSAVRLPQRQLTPGEFQKEHDDIEVELSVMVAEEPTVWSFEGLKPRAETLLEQAHTAVERGRARVLLNKIANFEDIRQRHEQVNLMRREVDRENRQLGDLAAQHAARTPLAKTDADRYDGSGRLARVMSNTPGAPRYALVGGDGKVQCYVTPAPGVNLQNYVGQQVGVNGVRGYMPQQQSDHVMAKHISLLDDTKLR